MRTALAAAPMLAALALMLGLRWFAAVAIARTMSHAGMITALAESASRIGRGWPTLSSAVGALGTFMTGSATASNILFTELQTTPRQPAA